MVKPRDDSRGVRVGSVRLRLVTAPEHKVGGASGMDVACVLVCDLDTVCSIGARWTGSAIIVGEDDGEPRGTVEFEVTVAPAKSINPAVKIDVNAGQVLHAAVVQLFGC